MIVTYAKQSAPTAASLDFAGALLGIPIEVRRSADGDINWGRATANTRLNPTIANTTNKRIMRELFATHDVPMPELVPFHKAEQMVEQFPLIGRPDVHTRGRGLWKCYTVQDVLKAKRGTRKKKAATHFMRYITLDEAPREYRVHIFLGKSIRISEKLFGQTGATAHGLYTTGKPRHEVKHVRAAAKKAVAALGLDFGAVDILAGDDNAFVLEVNAAPGLGGSMPQLYVKKFNEYLEGSNG